MTQPSVSPAEQWLLIIELVNIACMFISGPMMFKRAGRRFWYAWIPIVNILTLLEIAGMSSWWFLVMLLLFWVPFLVPIVLFVIWYRVARGFNRGILEAIGLWLLPGIFMFVLCLGSGGKRTTLSYRAGPQSALHPYWTSGGGPGAAGALPPGYGARGGGPGPAGAAAPYGAPAAPALPAFGRGAAAGAVPLSVPVPSVAIGWHHVGGDPTRQGYWDGRSWTHQIRWDGAAWVPC